MFTFRDYLLEATQPPAQVAQTVLEQCMPFVNSVGEVEVDTILYRGTNASIEDFMPRERTEAGGVTGQYSGDTGKMLRDYFNTKCGVNLDTIIFATGDPDIAKTFGNPYVIFPIGAFKFVYSKSGIPLPHVKTEADLEKANFVCGIADDTSDDGLPEPDFQNAIKSHNEILIYANSYLPISLSYWKANGQAILEELSFR